MMNIDTIRHLSSKYSVKQSMIRNLLHLSRLTQDTSKPATVRRMARESYDNLVAYLGVDPLV